MKWYELKVGDEVVRKDGTVEIVTLVRATDYIGSAHVMLGQQSWVYDNVLEGEYEKRRKC